VAATGGIGGIGALDLIDIDAPRDAFAAAQADGGCDVLVNDAAHDDRHRPEDPTSA